VTHPDRVCSSAVELYPEQKKQTAKESKHCIDRNNIGLDPLLGLILFHSLAQGERRRLISSVKTTRKSNCTAPEVR
jgi:hypothetical protein